MLALAIATGAGLLGALSLVLALTAVRQGREIRAGQRRIALEVELQTRVLAAAARLAATSGESPGGRPDAAPATPPSDGDGRPDGSPAR
ncbi:LapA family protein [Actinomadura harenae]